MKANNIYTSVSFYYTIIHSLNSQVKNNIELHRVSEMSTKAIILLHDDIITDFGGMEGILCLGTIDFLNFKCDQKHSVFNKAACALHLVIRGHPFMDGNKRTAFAIAESIMYEEGYRIIEKEEKIIKFLRKIAETSPDVCETVLIKNWIEKRSKRLNEPMTTF